jgi:hypothetical protein
MYDPECAVSPIHNVPLSSAAMLSYIRSSFQDAADRAVELLCGAEAEERTQIPEIAAEGRATA